MGLNRSSYYLSPATESEENLRLMRLMRLIDQQFLRTPFYGSRRRDGKGDGTEKGDIQDFEPKRVTTN